CVVNLGQSPSGETIHTVFETPKRHPFPNPPCRTNDPAAQVSVAFAAPQTETTRSFLTEA
ncbi:MAG TPA: hypothetical protein VEC58_08415, partial [Roseiarcus sp.]|nr:hypothetical protein [Roseiarcus sp.]